MRLDERSRSQPGAYSLPPATTHQDVQGRRKVEVIPAPLSRKSTPIKPNTQPPGDKLITRNRTGNLLQEKIPFPKEQIPFIMGSRGTNIIRMEQISGAKIWMRGRTDRGEVKDDPYCLVEGSTSDQIGSVVALLQSAIETVRLPTAFSRLKGAWSLTELFFLAGVFEAR